MQLFVGLGNPGAKYAMNRHNIGFMALDRVAEDHGFAPWRSKFQGAVSEGVLGGEKVLLLKPETFMNKSGQSVGEAMRFYKLAPGDVTVFHDELDLAPSKLKVKRATMVCGQSTVTLARPTGACVLASAIQGTKTPFPAMSCAIFRRRMVNGSMTSCVGSQTAWLSLPKETTDAS